MIEKTGNSLKFFAFFQSGGEAATGLTVTIDVYSPANSEIVTGASASELGDGVYYYTLSSASVSAAGAYVAVFHTASGADQLDIPALWVVGVAGIEHLDADISSRAGTDDVADVSTLEGRLTAARAGYLDALNVSGALAHTGNAATFQADVSELATTSGLAALEAHGDASWATYTGGGESDAPTVEEIRSEIDANSTQLSAIRADISGLPSASDIRYEMDDGSVVLARIPEDPAAATDYAGPTAEEIRSEMDTNSTALAHLDADVSSRLAAADYETSGAEAPTVEEIRSELDGSTRWAEVLSAVDDVAFSDDLSALAALEGMIETSDGGDRFRAVALGNAPATAASDVWAVSVSDGADTDTAAGRLAWIDVAVSSRMASDASLEVSISTGDIHDALDTWDPAPGAALIVPPDADLCRICMLLGLVGDEYPESVEGTCQIVSHYIDGRYVSGPTIDGRYNPGNGSIYWDVQQGSECIIRVPDYGIEARVLAPAQPLHEVRA